MNFAITTHRMPRLNTFAACAAFFASTPKPRNTVWEENERPLDTPRMHHKRLVKNSDGSYACVLYKCRHVTYHEDGRIEIQLYDSSSSKAFLQRMLPARVRIDTRSGRTLLEVATDNDIEWYDTDQSGFVLAPSVAGSWKVLSETVPRQREFVDRRKATEVRALAAPFLLWRAVTDKLVPFKERGDPYTLPYHAANYLNAQEDWHLLAPYAADKVQFLDWLYDVCGARKAQYIPANTSPRRGRRTAYT